MWKNKELQKFYKHEFDFKNQHKTTYDDWLKAFETAVARRREGELFIGMSSGYDSGALTNELLKQGADFKVFSVLNNEDEAIIRQRLAKMPNHEIAEMSKAKWQEYHDFLKSKINEKAMKDIASMGVAFMFETARKQGRQICISGQGGDEILSDYAPFPNQSHFKGEWPEELYEWPNFRGNMQLEYLNELEEIADIYNIEVRYPFLDVDLAQEYLWLSPEFKNRNYKAPLYEYLTRSKVPFNKAVKKGFRPIAV
jgi:asparagine synthetase B (glutamine-hydrolysing)